MPASCGVCEVGNLVGSPWNLSDSSSKLAGGEIAVLGKRKQLILWPRDHLCAVCLFGKPSPKAGSKAAQPSDWHRGLWFAVTGRQRPPDAALIPLYLVDGSASELRLTSGNLLPHLTVEKVVQGALLVWLLVC